MREDDCEACTREPRREATEQRQEVRYPSGDDDQGPGQRCCRDHARNRGAPVALFDADGAHGAGRQQDCARQAAEDAQAWCQSALRDSSRKLTSGQERYGRNRASERQGVFARTGPSGTAAAIARTTYAKRT